MSRLVESVADGADAAELFGGQWLAGDDGLHQHLGLFDSAQDDVVAPSGFRSACGRHRLFVFGVSVDDRGESVTRELLDLAPYFFDRAACGVDEFGSGIQQFALAFHGQSESRDDDFVAGRRGDGRVRFVGDKDSHFAQSRVDLRVVDDFGGEPECLARVVAASGIRQFDRASHTVAKPKAASEMNGERRSVEAVGVRDDLLDERTVIVLGDVESLVEFCVHRMFTKSLIIVFVIVLLEIFEDTFSGIANLTNSLAGVFLDWFALR